MADDLTLVQGDTEVLTLTIKDAAGAPLNLTGCSLRLTVKAHHGQDDADALFARTTPEAQGIKIESPASAGIATVTLLPAQTRLLTTGRWVYDVQVQDGGGRVSTVIRGLIKAAPDVSVTAP